MHLNPFALSLSKCRDVGGGFDKLSPNGNWIAHT
jgi:hypothetical protein